MTFKITLLILKLIGTAKSTKTNLSGHIVGGEFARIENFPYSAHVTINCNGRTSACGASILNQVLLLTAAHCVFKCKIDFTIKAYTASVYRYKGIENNVVHFIIHEEYDADSKANDIALLKLEKDLTFGPKVKRIVLVKVPPDYETAVVAGWGWIDSVGTKSSVMRHASQQVYNRSTCIKILNRIPVGSFCGRELEGGSYPERGDSGSALVVYDLIQIGIVSFKMRGYSNDTIIYTDIPYHYDWIKKKAEEMCCGNKNYRQKKRMGKRNGKVEKVEEKRKKIKRKMKEDTKIVRCNILMKRL